MVEVGALCSLLAWVYLALAHGRFWDLRALRSVTAEEIPSLSALQVAVVVPARNEAATIELCVRSLKQQDWPGSLSVIVVDDASTDETPILAARAGATTVLHASLLPPGWTGKLHALQTGVAAAEPLRPDFFLFTDADVVHHGSNIRELVSCALTHDLDLVSLMVRLHCRYPAERLLMPAFVFFFFMLYPPSRIARRGSRVAGAAGGCVLLRPEALARAGGLQSIRHEMIDDCSLARAVKQSGGKLWLGLSDRTRSLREYPHVADIRQMIARTAYTQLRYSPLLLAGCIAGMVLLFALPVVGAVSGLMAGGAALVLMAALYGRVVSYFGQPWHHAFLLPVAAAVYVWATLESAWRYHLRLGAEWKGRHQAQATGGSHGSR